jgi:hypothetical protein
MGNNQKFRVYYRSFGPFHNGPDLIPTLPGLPFGNPHQKQREEAKKDMSWNALILPMVEGPKFQSGLERAECPFYPHKLFIPQSHIFRTEAVIAGGKKILPIQARFSLSFFWINPERSTPQLPRVVPQGPMTQKSTGGLFMRCSPLMFQHLKGSDTYPTVKTTG